MTRETTSTTAKGTGPARRALFGLALGGLATLLLPAAPVDAAVVVVRRRRPVVVVTRPVRRRVLVVR